MNISPQSQRRGAVHILVALMLIGMLAMTTITVDIGYLLGAKEELQRSADAAALAACWEMVTAESDGATPSEARNRATAVARTYAGLNDVTNNSPDLATGDGGDVVFGLVTDPSDPSTFTTNTTVYNAVRVRVQKTNQVNGHVPFFMGGIFGKAGQETEASATAMMVSNVRGFRAPNNGENLGILPFALDLETWDAYLAGAFSDDYTYDEETETVTPGADGFREFNLYPHGTGAPGNRGTVDIGPPGNSTSDLARQITQGVSPQDLEDLGKPLELDSNGQLELNGDTGISAGVKDELASIIGGSRVIPVYSTVVGNGNNAQFTIVKWVGIRVMNVNLTGNKNGKRVLVQQAPVSTGGTVPSTGGSSSESVYSPAYLLQ